MTSTKNPLSREVIDLTVDSGNDNSDADGIENPDPASTEAVLRTVWEARPHRSTKSNEPPRNNAPGEVIKGSKSKEPSHDQRSHKKRRLDEEGNSNVNLNSEKSSLPPNGSNYDPQSLTHNPPSPLAPAKPPIIPVTPSRVQRRAYEASSVPSNEKDRPALILPEDRRARSGANPSESGGQPIATSVGTGQLLSDGLKFRSSVLALRQSPVQASTSEQASQSDRGVNAGGRSPSPTIERSDSRLIPDAEESTVSSTTDELLHYRNNGPVATVDRSSSTVDGESNLVQDPKHPLIPESSGSKSESPQVPPRGDRGERQEESTGKHAEGVVETARPLIPARGALNASSPAVGRNDFTLERRDAFTHLDRLTALSTEERTKALVDLVRQRMSGMNYTSTWSSEENALLVHTKEELCLTWLQIWQTFFRHRGSFWHTSQTHYSQKLVIRKRKFTSEPQGGLNAIQRGSIAPLLPPGRIQSIPTLRLRPRRISTAVASEPSTLVNLEVSDATDDTDQRQAPDLSVLEASKDRQTPKNFQHSKQRTNISLSNVPSSSFTTHAKISQLSYERLFNEKQRTEAALTSGTIRISPRIHIPSAKAQTKIARQPKRPDIHIQRPYLSIAERLFLKRSINDGSWNIDETLAWNEQLLHVDFTREELENFCPYILRVMGLTNKSQPLRPLLKHFLRDASDESLEKIARTAQNNGGIGHRTLDSLYSFLRDLSSSEEIERISYQRLALLSPRRSSCLAPLLRSRELGLHSPIRSQQQIRMKIPACVRETVEDTMGPLLCYTGTSGDVNTVAWSPSGEMFAAGSAALTDVRSMQYNLPNNLVFGKISSKSLFEVPYHATRREPSGEGVNALPSMQASQEPLLFQSVSAVQFSPDGQAMISTGYDKFARLWDVRNSWPECNCAFRHNAEIDVLSVNSSGLFATGSKTSKSKSVNVFKYDLDVKDKNSLKVHRLFSPKARANHEKEIYPSCLRWGNSIYGQQKYLICGFTSSLQDYGEGETCLWDVEVAKPIAITRGGRNVFDVAWSPLTFGRFAVGSSPSHGGSTMLNKGTRSIIRIFDSRNLSSDPNTSSSIGVNTLSSLELECPARDMNDVVFNPSDELLISVGCTDGSTYIWDIRKPDSLLHKFNHGPAVLELDHSLDREEADTGVRFLSWGGTRRLLYTGSSDGVVVQWDPYRSPEDAYIHQVVQLNSGVMSGAFSPDFSNLLLGEISGSIMVLGFGQEGECVRQCQPFSFHKADDSVSDEVYSLLEIQEPTPGKMQAEQIGISAARQLVNSGAIAIKPFGDLPFRQAVQGPSYVGPFDRANDASRLRQKAEDFQKRFKLSSAREPQEADRYAVTFTEEEKGDSGAWKSHIPEAFRFNTGYSSSKLKCLRCGELTMPDAGVEMITCESCKVTWRVDLLGYSQVSRERVERSRSAEEGEGKAHENAWQTTENDVHDTLIHENFEDYIHGKWQDRSTPPA